VLVRERTGRLTIFVFEEYVYAFVFVTRSCCRNDSFCAGWLLGQQSQFLLFCTMRIKLQPLWSQLL